jgi:enoyl-CoA hydratase/carnithine racemase
MLWRGLGYTHPHEANDLESLMVLSRGASPDAYEGAQSFLEKRAPNFRQAVSVDMPEGPWSLE